MFQLKNQSIIVLGMWALLLVSLLVAMGLGRWSLAFVSLATFLLSVAPSLLAFRYSITLPVPFVIAIIAYLFASIFLGEAFDFYERLWWWDLALHGFSAVGFGLTGFLFTLMLFEGDRYAAPHGALAFISFCIAMTVGATWEVFEFSMDQVFGLNMQKSGLDDTISDLVLNGFGALLASVSGYYYLRGSKTGILTRVIFQFVAANRRLFRKSKVRFPK